MVWRLSLDGFVAVSRFAFTLDDGRRTNLKRYAAAHGMSAAAVLKAVIDRLPMSENTRETPGKRGPTDRQVKIRLTNEELAELDRHVAQLGFATRASWLTRVAIEALNRSPIATNDETTELRRSRSDLASVGRNLNQIARALNIDATSRAPSADELNQAIEAISDHKRAVMELIDRIERRGAA